MACDHRWHDVTCIGDLTENEFCPYCQSKRWRPRLLGAGESLIERLEDRAREPWTAGTPPDHRPDEVEAMSLQNKVDRALSNAGDNGYSFEGWSAVDIVADLQACDADLEGEDPAEVLVAVIKWQAAS